MGALRTRKLELCSGMRATAAVRKDLVAVTCIVSTHVIPNWKTKGVLRDAPDRPRGPVQAAGLAVLGLAMVSQIEIAEAADVATTTAGGGCVLVAALVLGGVTTVKRGTDAVGELVDSTKDAGHTLVNVTAEAAAMVIEEFGKKSKRLVPTVLGVISVLVLLGLKILVDYF